MFSNSELADVSVSALTEDYGKEFYKSPGFWVMVFLILGFALGCVLVLKVIPNLCIMEKLENDPSPSMVKVFITAFLVRKWVMV